MLVQIKIDLAEAHIFQGFNCTNIFARVIAFKSLQKSFEVQNDSITSRKYENPVVLSFSSQLRVPDISVWLSLE